MESAHSQGMPCPRSSSTVRRRRRWRVLWRSHRRDLLKARSPVDGSDVSWAKDRHRSRSSVGFLGPLGPLGCQAPGRGQGIFEKTSSNGRSRRGGISNGLPNDSGDGMSCEHQRCRGVSLPKVQHGACLNA